MNETTHILRMGLLSVNIKTVITELNIQNFNVFVCQHSAKHNTIQMEKYNKPNEQTSEEMLINTKGKA